MKGMAFNGPSGRMTGVTGSHSAIFKKTAIKNMFSLKKKITCI
jgi:hypothetical protein